MEGNEYFGRPVELTSAETRLWHGDEMRPLDIADCDRIVIADGMIEFQMGSNYILISLKDEHFFIDHIAYASPVEDKQLTDFKPSAWLTYNMSHVKQANN